MIHVPGELVQGASGSGYSILVRVQVAAAVTSLWSKAQQQHIGTERRSVAGKWPHQGSNAPSIKNMGVTTIGTKHSETGTKRNKGGNHVAMPPSCHHHPYDTTQKGKRAYD